MELIGWRNPIMAVLMMMIVLLTILDLESVNAANPGLQVERPKYGYQDGEITQGIGYGHHLHPFYYQGKMAKYYNCAIEDDWRPFSGDSQMKITKASPPKKYNRYHDATMKFNGPKKRMVKKVMSRNDRNHESKLVEREHAKLISEINGMYERRPLAKYRILVPETLQTEETMLDDAYNPEPATYRVFEQSLDAPQNHYMKKVSATAVPFQKYKKFKVVTLKPSSVHKLKYFGVPLGAKMPSESLGYPRPFISNMPENKDGGLGLRNGKRLPYQRPHLTMLEQFLMLFPKLM